MNRPAFLSMPARRLARAALLAAGTALAAVVIPAGIANAAPTATQSVTVNVPMRSFGATDTGLTVAPGGALTVTTGPIPTACVDLGAGNFQETVPLVVGTEALSFDLGFGTTTSFSLTSGGEVSVGPITGTIGAGASRDACVASTTPVTLTYTSPVTTATATTLASSANPSVAGQQVTYTATVNPAPDGGKVAFTEGGATISGCGTVQVSSTGTATCQVTYTSTGSHSITATYGGDNNFTSSSGSVTQTVDQAATTTAVASSASTSTVGQPVTFTATVGANSPGAGTPTGTVTFADGSTTLGTGTLNSSGTAAITTSALVVGSHTITAAYSGDGNFTGSTSTALTQQVAYKVQPLYDPTKASNSGTAVPVKIQLLNAAGTNVSASGIKVTVTGLSPSPSPGKAPAGTFTFMTLDQGPGYQLNVKTAGYPAGTYTLSFTASGDPTVHTAQFVIG
jgi:hypothetical protein